jgi:hypothetical protein
MIMKKFTILSVAVLLAASGSFAQAQHVDGPGVLGLWHMEAITPNVTDTPTGSFTGDAILDDDSANPGRNSDQLLGTPADFAGGVNQPSLTTGGGGVFGEAMDLDGDDMSYSILGWAGAAFGLDSVKVDLYFKETHQDPGTQVIATATSTWEISIGTDALRWITWLDAGGADIMSVTLDAPGDWRHVEAWHDTAGNKVFMLDGAVIDSGSPGALKQQNKSLTIGNKENQDRYFTGLIDEVLVSRVAIPEPTTGVLAMGFLATLALRRRK